MTREEPIRRTKAFVEPSIKRILEYENDLVNCLRQIVDNLEDGNKLAPLADRLKGLVNNETTSNTFLGLGGVSLVIYMLAVYPENHDLRRTCCELLRKLVESGPKAVQLVTSLEGPDTLMDIILEAPGDSRLLESCFSTLSYLATMEKCQEVIVERGFLLILTAILRDCENPLLVKAAVRTLSAFNVENQRVRLG